MQQHNSERPVQQQQDLPCELQRIGNTKHRRRYADDGDENSAKSAGGGMPWR